MKRGFVRIIAGKWRGRQISIPEVADLRPTPDRVRETVFNWLAPYLPGRRCLDLFTGSGAMGLEALSRGASYVEMADASLAVIAHIQNQLRDLQAYKLGMVYQATIPAGLKKPNQPFEVVFIDPPYAADLLIVTCEYLEKQNFLSAEAYIYLEASTLISDNALPDNWQIIKHKQAGNVFYHLAKRTQHESK